MDEETKNTLIAALKNYRTASKIVEGQVAMLLEDYAVWTDHRATAVAEAMDNLHEAERMYRECLAAAGWAVPHKP